LNEEITGGIARYMKKNERGEIDNEQDAYVRGVLELARKQNFAFIPLYGTIDMAGEAIARQSNTVSDQPNQLETIEMLLTSFPCISEQSIRWEQVVEFRKDITCIGGMRKIRTLLVEVAKCESTVEISDTVGLAIDNYKEACAKHGVDLVSSIFNQIYDKNTLIAGIGTGFITGNPETGVLVGGVKLLADISMTVYSSKRNRAEMLEKHQMGEAALHLRKLSDMITKGSE
jgi:hypothetical protein